MDENNEILNDNPDELDDLDYMNEDNDDEVIDESQIDNDDIDNDDIDEDNDDEDNDDEDDDLDYLSEEEKEEKQKEDDLNEKIKALQEELEKVKSSKKETVIPKEEVEEKEDEFPTLGDYDYDDAKYQEAVYKFYRKKEKQEELNEKRQLELDERNRVELARVQSIATEHRRKIEEVKETKYKDFDKLLEKAQTYDILSDEAAILVMEDNNSVDLHYYLLRNPEKFNEIAKMPISRQISEVNKISKKIGKKINEINEIKRNKDFSPLSEYRAREISEKTNNRNNYGVVEAYKNSKNRLIID